ncbi:MAG: outer membrane protein/peptidoglycan-associated protein [Bacteroidetes bacterium]|jgi:outer membrane protein OmpA-like peptidoglycan-associated protein|nr:outer membrane protein/peptidoglycan-associated protein [Bacteroidota bacterium]
MKKYIFLLGSAFLLSNCAERHYKKGLHNYEEMAYAGAIDHFEKYLVKKDNPDAMAKLADSYRLTNDIPSAEKWYSKVVSFDNSQPVNMLHYARILMRQEKYEEAKLWLSKYLKQAPDDFVAELLLVSCNTLNTFKTDTTLYSVKEIEIPEVSASFGSTPFANGVIFTADKPVFKKTGKYPWTGRSYLDLYFSRKDSSGKWLSPMLLKGDINGEFHEGPACFNKDGNVVYYTRSNYSGKKLKKNAKNESNLKLFRAELKDNKWVNIQELPFNSDDYSCGHPWLSPDENTLYFVSDMPGSFGGTDIYKSTFTGNGWSNPENLGASINTSGNEMFPYMHPDGTFYFSSDSHISLGGLDVFMTSYDGKKWLQAENLNYPLNSAGDDFAYVLSKDNKTGYLSSNRNGQDKLFEVTKNGPTFILTGFVHHKGKNQGIDSATVYVLNTSDREKEICYTNRTGQFKIKLKPNSDYSVNANKAMFFPVTGDQFVTTKGKKISETFTVNFELDQLVLEKPIVLQNIYYDLDKWNIRPDAALELDKLVQVLSDNPGIYIELSSHTDSRAGDQYNLVLSDKRAKAAVNYIISKGIDAARLKWKGYGETRLVNKCVNKVTCSEEEHQANRRTEFKVIKINNIASAN